LFSVDQAIVLVDDSPLIARVLVPLLNLEVVSLAFETNIFIQEALWVSYQSGPSVGFLSNILIVCEKVENDEAVLERHGVCHLWRGCVLH
jgi:hypothetical protein